MEKVNRFDILAGIDVGENVEKKNGLSYLSWAWAWSTFKSKFPNSYYTIYENENGWNYFTDGKTCWVKTGVTLVDGDFKLEHIEYLPLMDFRNKSIPLESVTSFEVNKSIQRSLTKAVARHGLGLYIYAGEDLPPETEESKEAKRAAENAIKDLIDKIDTKVKSVTKDMTSEQKSAFAKEKIIPAIGQMNYKACKDIEKLTKLLETL